ncbi:anthranilate synthase component I [Bermanella marisrubri]|uniref:Anthranilate synthase component 1 n=1 Tax=Bermanella marisrubri TaxID=207949 RepID=Q1N3L4_9GAMM|nr:anthranilate synthase component I [Bermanella marisrubri]EAT12860.1 anthranilate synthase component I [Oceanobacter sp. RED65] [Bermanella marisrubri]QIZ83181.1 anthranilate synthase component I [Bermanella marisrubri]
MTPELYTELSQQGYNRIPVFQEVLADLDTPLSAYLKVAKGPYSYLLESVQGGEKWGRYSMIGLPCRRVLKVFDHEVQIIEQDSVIERHEVDDPLDFIAEYQKQFNVAPIEGLPRFDGGLVGYFGYDVVRYVEKRLTETCPEDEIGNPDILLMQSEEVVVFDNLSGKLFFIVLADPSDPNAFAKAKRRITLMRGQLRRAYQGTIGQPLIQPRKVVESDFISGFGEENFQQSVEKIKEYVLAGDIMQCVISQRMTVDYQAEPLNLYRALRTLNPSPYMYFMDLGDHHVVGSSPEILARFEDGTITVRPIAGTRYRGQTPEQDQALEEELLADPKEIAEHLMLIDLGRNDVGRVSEMGQVSVTDQMVVERYSHVMHIVSNVEGKAKPGITSMDVLRAAHPAGTLSGAPKIRAMEIIDEMEPVKRGVYGGAVGYLSWNGNMDTAIAIRTAVIKGGKLYVQAGAGVVADSVPRLEWKETMNKGRALFKAVEMAESGLDN